MVLFRVSRPDAVKHLGVDIVNFLVGPLEKEPSPFWTPMRLKFLILPRFPPPRDQMDFREAQKIEEAFDQGLFEVVLVYVADQLHIQLDIVGMSR
jgi:hypothetical protein